MSENKEAIMMNSPKVVDYQFSRTQNLRTRIDGHDQLCSNKKGWFPWVIEQIDLKLKESVLEIGSGTGDL